MIGPGLRLEPGRRLPRRNLLIVGSDSIAGRLSPRLEDTGEVQVVGYLDDHGSGSDQPDQSGLSNQSDRKCLGRVRDLRQVCEQQRVDQVLLAMSRWEEEAAESLAPLWAGGRRVIGGGRHPMTIVPSRYVVLPQKVVALPNGHGPGGPARDRKVTDPGSPGAGRVAGEGVDGRRPPQLASGAKRAMDIVGAGAALVVSLPVLIAAAVAIRLTSRGPVMYRQQRVGLDGREFSMLKLRSMRVEKHRPSVSRGSGQPGSGTGWDGAPVCCVGPFPKLKHDPRVTRVGRVLRRLSIDELPQLWNVLRGDMSLVGPRPFVPDDAGLIEDWARDRTTVRPGVTGLWQVAGRNDVTFEDMCRLDHLYVYCWSLRLDVQLLVRTVPAVLKRSGAY